MISQLGDVQEKFRNAYAVVLNADNDQWNFLLQSLGCGLLRLLRCSSCDDGGKNLMTIYAALKDAQRLKLQKDYFSREHKKQMEEPAARHVVISSFNKLGISESDGQLIADGFPDIKSIITASLKTLSANSPADKLSIEKVANFFGEVENPGSL